MAHITDIPNDYTEFLERDQPSARLVKIFQSIFQSSILKRHFSSLEWDEALFHPQFDGFAPRTLHVNLKGSGDTTLCISPHSRHYCVKSLWSSYMGLYPQTGGKAMTYGG